MDGDMRWSIIFYFPHDRCRLCNEPIESVHVTSFMVCYKDFDFVSTCSTSYKYDWYWKFFHGIWNLFALCSNCKDLVWFGMEKNVGKETRFSQSNALLPLENKHGQSINKCNSIFSDSSSRFLKRSGTQLFSYFLPRLH